MTAINSLSSRWLLVIDKRLMRGWTLAGLVLLTPLVHGQDILAIAHRDTSLSRAEIIRVYRSELSGYKAYVLKDEAMQESFDRDYIGMGARDLKYLQDQALFAGRGLPPKKLETVQIMLETIANTPYSVGFIPADAVTDAVRVVK